MTTRAEVQIYHLSRVEAVLHGAEPDTPPRAAPARPAAQGAGMRIEVERGAAAAKPATEDNSALLAPSAKDDGFGDMNMFNSEQDIFADVPAAAAGPRSAAEVKDMAKRLAALKAEGIAPRQLRIAQRIAAMHEIDAATGEEAVILLRLRGIDPFHRDALRRAVAEEGARANARPAANAPSVVERKGPPATTQPARPPGMSRGKAPLPSSGELSEERRAAEIYRIQRDIARRRRNRMMMLFMRLAAFVVIPTLVTGWYYFTQATPLYATYSQFQIQQATASSSSGLGGLGGLLSGSGLGSNPDSVGVQSYLTSRDAMLRLDEDMGFKRVFQDPSIDPLTRLAPDATNEAAYGTYKSSVKIGYDPSEGVINMEVIAPDPDLSREFSLALIQYAEDQVDQMTARLRADQMEGARETYDDAEAGVQAALMKVRDLQQRLGVLDPAAEGSVVMSQIATMEAEMVRKRLDLGTLESASRPNASRVEALKGEIARLQELIDTTRMQLTEDTAARNSLAAITGDLRVAEADLLTRQQLLASAAAQLEMARVEANKQVRYLSLSVAPIAPDEPTYPRAWQNTFVAFLIFAGIYLMLSLTASILREQVSS